MNLAAKSCRSYEDGWSSLSEDDINIMLNELNEWIRIDSSLQKRFTFQNFKESIEFVNTVAVLAESEDHHPDITISWNQVTISLTTHAVHGLSENDFIMASKIDQINS